MCKRFFNLNKLFSKAPFCPKSFIEFKQNKEFSVIKCAKATFFGGSQTNAGTFFSGKDISARVREKKFLFSLG